MLGKEDLPNACPVLLTFLSDKLDGNCVRMVAIPCSLQSRMVQDRSCIELCFLHLLLLSLILLWKMPVSLLPLDFSYLWSSPELPQVCSRYLLYLVPT
jgi:hypothetical protein